MVANELEVEIDINHQVDSYYATKLCLPVSKEDGCENHYNKEAHDYYAQMNQVSKCRGNLDITLYNGT